MQILAESKHFIIFNEYETVTLKIKELQQTVQIGDFYGDPQMALISDDEKFCVVCGCGIIIYFLQKPFEDYEYNKQTAQWKEWGRLNGIDDIWVENIKCSDNQYIEIETEDGQMIKLNVYELR